MKKNKGWFKVSSIFVDHEYYILESSNTIENLTKFREFNNGKNFKKVVLFKALII